MKKSSLNLHQIVNYNFFYCLLVVVSISSCSAEQPFNIEQHLGLYRVAESQCIVPVNSFNPCNDTQFIEIVKGQFMGVKDTELTYVFWSGEPNIAPDLLYSSHLIKNHASTKLVDNKLWLNSDGNSQEYFGFEDGFISNYYVKYTTDKGDEVREIRYALKPVKRQNLPSVRLNYPGNKE